MKVKNIFQNKNGYRISHVLYAKYNFSNDIDCDVNINSKSSLNKYAKL